MQLCPSRILLTAVDVVPEARELRPTVPRARPAVSLRRSYARNAAFRMRASNPRFATRPEMPMYANDYVTLGEAVEIVRT